MSNFVESWHFFKNTFGENFIVRVCFKVKVPAFYSLVANNMCRCDHWFSRDGNVKIEYDIVDDNNNNRPVDEVIEKSIIVDLHGPFLPKSKIELLVSDGIGKNDYFTKMISEVPDDLLVSRE